METAFGTVALLQRQHSGTSDSELITKIRHGECKLFHELIRPYERGLFAAAYAILRNQEDAEEVVQEAVMKAFQRLDQLREEDRFKNWLIRITINEAQLRKRKYKRHLFESLEHPNGNDSEYMPKQFPDWRDLPSDFVEREELRTAVAQAIERLPDMYREIYLLSAAQQTTMEELSRTLGISLASAKTRLHRARLMVQEKLDPAFRARMRDRLLLLKGLNPWSLVRK